MSVRRSVPPPVETEAPGLDPASVSAVQECFAKLKNGKPEKDNIVRRTMKPSGFG
jgi:hypothetical protein